MNWRPYLASFLAGCGLILSTGAECAPARGQVSISGRQLLKDGEPWTPRLMPIVGTAVPQALESSNCIMPALQIARENLSERTFRALQSLGADSVRITVTEGGFDPASREYDPGYAADVVHWVKYARSLGLNVVLTMKPLISKCVPTSTLPDESTANAWRILAPRFANDHGVLFEVFTEPNSSIDSANGGEPGADDWQAWQTAFDTLIAEIRRTGARNVLIIQGLVAGKVFREEFPVTDAYGNYMYGIHVYFNARIPFNSPHGWDRYFGNFCRQSGHPCLITEWQDSGKPTPEGHPVGCNGNAPQQAQSLIDYAMRNRWGIGAWAFDFPNTVMVGSSLTQPTSYAGWTSCADPAPWGNGEVLFRAFRNPAWGR
jgi:hypothetical protein